MKYKRQVAGALAGLMVLSMGSMSVFAEDYIKSPNAEGLFTEKISSGVLWVASSGYIPMIGYYDGYDASTDTFNVVGNPWIEIENDGLNDLNNSIKTGLAYKSKKNSAVADEVIVHGLDMSKWSISKENIATLLARDGSLVFYGEDKEDGYDFDVYVYHLTEAKEFNFNLSPATNEKVAAKLKAAGYSKYNRMLTISGTGKLGIGSINIAYTKSGATSTVPKYHEKGYLYYYNASTESFELLSTSDFYEDEYKFFLDSDDSAGTYVWTEEKLPATVAANITTSDADLSEADTTAKVTTALSDDIKTMLENKELASGDQYSIVMEKKDVKVAKTIFTQLKDAGVTPRIEDVNKASTWVFKDMSNLDGMTGDFDPTTTIGSGILPEVDKLAATKAKDIKYTTVSFAYDGKLPGKTDVTLDLSNAGIFTEGQTVYMYLYDATSGAFTEEKSATYANGFATFTIDHCSDYIVTASLISETQTTSQSTAKTASQSAAKTGDNATTLVFVLALIAGAAVLGYAVYGRKYRA